MSSDNLKLELQAFLNTHPDSRFMDAIAPDMNGILRGKWAQTPTRIVFGICHREESDAFNSEVSNKDYEWYLRAM